MKKQIIIKEDIWRKLNKAKYDLNLHTISDVIERLFKIAEKIENARGKKI